MKKDNQIRVALYARVSTKEQAEEGYSIDAQLKILNEYCRQHHKIPYKEYVDRGISGKSIEHRLSLQKLLQDAREGLFDEVIVWKISRLSRKQLDLLNIIDELDKYDVVFRSYSEKFETETPSGKFSFQMMGSVSELERNTLVENVRMGMKQRAREGKWNGGIVLGYNTTEVVTGNRKNKETKLEIVPAEALIVKKIFTLYAHGKGLKAITNQLNHEGYKTKREKNFSTNAVKIILHNPIYVGKIRFNTKSKRSKSKNLDENILVDGEHEPIISKELWDTVQALYKTKSFKPAKTFYGSYPLTGIIKCPVCGASMVAHRAKYKLKDGTTVIKRYYACGNWRNKGTAVCNSNSVVADYAEQYLYDRLKEVICTPKILKDIVENINDRKSDGVKPIHEELKHVIKELDGIESNKNKYFTLFEDDNLDSDILIKRLDSLTERKNNLLKKKAELENNLNNQVSEPISYEYVKRVLTDLQANLKNALPEQEKTILQLFIDRIILDSDRTIKIIRLKFDEELQKNILNSKEESSIKGDSSFICKNNSNFYPLLVIRLPPTNPKSPINLFEQYHLHELMGKCHL